MSSETSSLFAVGERVLVPHTDKCYEAKVLKAERRDDGMWYYFLHYSGWNKKYDEWVEATGLSKASGQGDTIPGLLNQAKVNVKKIPKEKLSVRKLGDNAPGYESTNASGTQLSQLELDMPLVLKKVLLDDYDANISDARIVPLPRSPSIADVLSRYINDYVSENGSDSLVLAEEVAAGLRLYFDRAVMHSLLYRGERPQATRALSGGRAPSAVFGCEHLLRLLVKLPELLQGTHVPELQVQQLSEMLQTVLDWLAERYGELLLPTSQYISISPEGPEL